MKFFEFEKTGIIAMEIFDENACAIDELTRENSKRSMENLNTNKPESKKWK